MKRHFFDDKTFINWCATMPFMEKTFPIYRTGIGRESHRFLPDDSSKPCVIGGVMFDGAPGLDSESDGDVVYHAICNAITSLTGVPILAGLALDLCRKDGITDSQVYLQQAVETLGKQLIVHVALTIEGKRPRFDDAIQAIRSNIASVLAIRHDQVGLTATSGDGLTDFGCGDGLECVCILTTVERQ